MGLSHSVVLFRGIKAQPKIETRQVDNCAHNPDKSHKYCPQCGTKVCTKETSYWNTDLFQIEVPNRFGKVSGDFVYRGYDVVRWQSSKDLWVGDIVKEVDPRYDDPVQIPAEAFDSLDDIKQLAEQMRSDGFEVTGIGFFLLPIVT